MRKLLLISLISLSSTLYADTSIGVRIQAPIENGYVDIGFRDDDHRYDNRYRNFDYNRYGYYDDYGYYFGYFDRVGYFFNNIFFLYDANYTYYDRLYKRGFFRPSHAHFRKYNYHTRGNNWNNEHRFRENNQKVYGPYYERRDNIQRDYPRKEIIRRDEPKRDYHQRENINRNDRQIRDYSKRDNANRNDRQNGEYPLNQENRQERDSHRR